MRIALVIDRFDPSRGGGETYAVSLARTLVGAGHEVHVIAGSCSQEEKGLRFHPIRIVSTPRWAKGLSFALSAGRKIKELDCDVVQGFGGVPGTDVYRPGGGVERAWVGQDILSRTSPFSRGYTALKRACSLKVAINRFIERSIYSESGRTRIVANSEMVKRDILRYYPKTDPKRIAVIRNGVDIERFHPKNKYAAGRAYRRSLGIREKDVVIAFLAHNYRLKGLHCLLDALHSVDRTWKNWILLIAGRGKRRSFDQTAERYGIGSKVRFLGPTDTPETILGASDILAHPTFYDPFSNVCLEAMAAGLPVITTSFCGTSEIIEHGGGGIRRAGPEGDRSSVGLHVKTDGTGRKEQDGTKSKNKR